jgi:hypothetical protein
MAAEHAGHQCDANNLTQWEPFFCQRREVELVRHDDGLASPLNKNQVAHKRWWGLHPSPWWFYFVSVFAVSGFLPVFLFIFFVFLFFLKKIINQILNRFNLN